MISVDGHGWIGGSIPPVATCRADRFAQPSLRGSPALRAFHQPHKTNTTIM